MKNNTTLPHRQLLSYQLPKDDLNCTLTFFDTLLIITANWTYVVYLNDDMYNVVGGTSYDDPTDQ